MLYLLYIYIYSFFSILQIQKRLKSHPVQLAPATNRVHKNPCLWSYVMLPMTYLGPRLLFPSDIGKSAWRIKRHPRCTRRLKCRRRHYYQITPQKTANHKISVYTTNPPPSNKPSMHYSVWATLVMPAMPNLLPRYYPRARLPRPGYPIITTCPKWPIKAGHPSVLFQFNWCLAVHSILVPPPDVRCFSVIPNRKILAGIIA